MRIPGIRRETEDERLQRVAAKEARRLAREKAWRRFWFQVKLVIAAMCLSALLVFAGLVYLGRNAPPVSARPVERFEAAAPVAKPQPKETKRVKTIESAAEKKYEAETGDEIVHRKEGSTFIRKANRAK